MKVNVYELIYSVIPATLKANCTTVSLWSTSYFGFTRINRLSPSNRKG